MYLAVEDFMHAATQRLWETFWDTANESQQMPFFVMGPHTSASETLAVRSSFDHKKLESIFQISNTEAGAQILLPDFLQICECSWIALLQLA